MVSLFILMIFLLVVTVGGNFNAYLRKYQKSWPFNSTFFFQLVTEKIENNENCNLIVWRKDKTFLHLKQYMYIIIKKKLLVFYIPIGSFNTHRHQSSPIRLNVAKLKYTRYSCTTILNQAGTIFRATKHRSSRMGN